MEKILTVKQANVISKKLREENKKIILTGGCFDILHPGHLQLLEHAKQKGDILFVLLENDEKIKQVKGPYRPIFQQTERAKMLAAFACVDYVVILPFLKTNDEYDTIITNMHPTIIATTEHDPRIQDKNRQAEKIGAKVLEVTDYLPQYATSKIIALLEKEM